jgi:heme exporter protein A
MQLAIERLTCVRGERRLFENLSFALAPGQALLVTGPNGAGKTSLLRLIAGLIVPATGRITLDGESPSRARESIHLLGHLDAAKGALTVTENLTFARTLAGGDGSVAHALDAVGVKSAARLPVRVLSAGQKRRLALARLLVSERPLWLLDEPTATLDVDGQRRLAAMIAAHRARGGLAIVASHAAVDLADAAEIRLQGVAA